MATPAAAQLIYMSLTILHSHSLFSFAFMHRIFESALVLFVARTFS